MSFIKYIANESHYKEVLSLVSKAKQTVWIGTADIKDLYVDDKPFLALLASLLKKGVEVRLIHAKEPGRLGRRITRNIRFSMTAWNVCCVREFISSSLSLTVPLLMSALPTSLVPAWA